MGMSLGYPNASLMSPAIRFVLADAYTSLGREERQSLLHAGASTTTTLSAYVEIVFDSKSSGSIGP